MIDWQTQFDALRRNPRTPLIGTFFLGACLLWAISSFTATFLEKKPVPTKKAILSTRPPVNLSELHLFGVYSAALVNLPNSQLPLALQGTVVVSDLPANSQALISPSGQPALVYHTGDTLPGNVTITHITENYVIINDNGTLEKLPLPIQTAQNSE